MSKRAKTLASVTKRLGRRYDKWKDAERLKKESQQDFFELATVEVNKDESLARKTVYVYGELKEAREHIAQYHPGWIVETYQHSDQVGDEIAFVLVEDPQYKPYKYVNRDLGLVFEREIRQGSVTLDDERLRKEDPELWQRVTQETRVLKDLDELDEEDTADLQRYVYRDKPRVALRQPRKATEEELGE